MVANTLGGPGSAQPSIGPVYWGSHPGETLEKLMAVLISQEHPSALRRTPSSGDGGVDVIVEEGDGFHVRQVKGFAGRMNANRRRQVEKSFRTLLDDPRLSRPVTRWTLTVPIDPTSGEQEWFEELTDGASFPSSWEGETFWHRMAASHAHVIDYYLRDGRARVEERSERLIAVAEAPTGPLMPDDVAGYLELLRVSLNKDDPHYRYEFLTGSAPPRDDSLPPEVVLAATRSIDGGGFLTIFVVPKHRYSTQDAPITGSLSVRVSDPNRGIDLRDAIADFQTFGTALEVPEGALDFSISAPGGLGGEFTGGSGRIGPMYAKSPPEMTRLRLVHPEEGVIAEVGLVTLSATRGQLGGIEVRTRDDAGILNAVFRAAPPRDEEQGVLTFNVTVTDPHGRPVQEVMPVARLVSGWVAPNRLEWLEEHGTGTLAAHSFKEDLSLVTPGFLAFLENLAVIQGHARGVVEVPAEFDEDIFKAVAEVAHLIRHGEVKGTWKDMEVQLKEGVTAKDVATQIGEEGALLLETSLALTLGERTYDLGVTQQIAATARLAEEQPPDGRALRFVPGSDDSYTHRLAGSKT